MNGHKTVHVQGNDIKPAKRLHLHLALTRTGPPEPLSLKLLHLVDESLPLLPDHILARNADVFKNNLSSI